MASMEASEMPRPPRGLSGARTLPSVMLVDDHPLWRETLRKVLQRKKAGRVVAEASDGDEAIRVAGEADPDVTIMDIDLPLVDGVEATRRILEQRPGAKVLALSASQSKADVVEAVRAGASGYLLKTAGSSEIAEAVQRVAVGELVFPASLSAIVLEELRRAGRPQAEEGPLPTERDIGSSPGDSGEEAVANNPGPEHAFVREGEFWTLAFGGEVVRMADSKGMHDLAALLEAPGREIHALDLVTAREGGATSGAAEGAVADDGLQPAVGEDGGATLDHAAKRAYRERLDELRDQAEEAESWGDKERAAKARQEFEFLTRELASAMGLGGRDRKMGSVAERARLSVTRAIRSAIERIDKVHPALARHLSSSIRTGTFSCYDPEEPPGWVL